MARRIRHSAMLTPFETSLIGLLLVVLMFGMGATLTPAHFRDVARRPKAFLIGTASQFGWMPLIAFGLSHALSLPPEAALGLIVMGSCPGGTTSNLFAQLSRADLALSVSMTAASKVVGIALMPLCLFLYARPFSDASLRIPYGEIVKTLVVLLVPVALAMAIRARRGERFGLIAEKVGSIAGLSVLILLVTLSVVRNAGLFALTPPSFYAAAIFLSGLGMLLGYGAARAAGLSVPERRTVAFETGVPNSPLCFAILLTSFPQQSQLLLLGLPMLCALVALTNASLLSAIFRSSPQTLTAGSASPRVGS
jgi:bile acid transporter